MSIPGSAAGWQSLWLCEHFHSELMSLLLIAAVGPECLGGPASEISSVLWGMWERNGSGTPTS